MNDESTRLREQLVDALTANGSISGDDVRAAFRAVPRELFVPMVHAVRGLAGVYADAALITKERHGTATSSSSQPSIMAQMLEALRLREGMRVLEIGLGSGYNAALLATIVGPDGRVTSIDNDGELVASARERLARAGCPVEAVHGDGHCGWAAAGPYDRIIVTASTAAVPRAWWRQLSPDGLLVTPLRIGAMQLIAVLTRTATGFRSTAVIPGGFMPLREDDTDNPVATLTVTLSIPGARAANVTAQGPGVAELSGSAAAKLPGILLSGPETRAVAPTSAWPLVWRLVLAVDAKRQLSVYTDRPGFRVGLVDAATGGCAVLVATRQGDDWVVDAVEGYGEHTLLTGELLAYIDDTRGGPQKSLHDIHVTVGYEGDAMTAYPKVDFAALGRRWPSGGDGRFRRGDRGPGPGRCATARSRRPRPGAAGRGPATR